jgi:hypothetical protein
LYFNGKINHDPLRINCVCSNYTIGLEEHMEAGSRKIQSGQLWQSIWFIAAFLVCSFFVMGFLEIGSHDPFS